MDHTDEVISSDRELVRLTIDMETGCHLQEDRRAPPGFDLVPIHIGVGNNFLQYALGNPSPDGPGPSAIPVGQHPG